MVKMKQRADLEKFRAWSLGIPPRKEGTRRASDVAVRPSVLTRIKGPRRFYKSLSATSKWSD